jgi:1-acyl-sn-glycerol-3-phosphate acyltransferase
MFVRALVFNAVVYTSLTLWMVLGAPFLLLPRRWLIGMMRAWGRVFLWECRVFGGLKVEFRGLDNIPDGPLLIASKHQSAWETLAFLAVFKDPCFILKRELSFIPLFGWYAIKSNQVPVDRRGGNAVMKALVATAKREAHRDGGRQIIFFPEGTRRPIDAEPQYRYGVALAYSVMKVPCVPVAINAGLYWPRRSLKLRPGTILVEFLPPIPPDLPRDDFFQRMQQEIEASTRALVAEGRAALGDTAPVPQPAA